jgi:hypothetical protein
MKDRFLEAMSLLWTVCEFIVVLCIVIPCLCLYHLFKLVYNKIKKTRFDHYHRAKIDKRP